MLNQHSLEEIADIHNLLVDIKKSFFDVATKNFNDKNVNLVTLSNYQYLLEQALDSNYINENELVTLKEWSSNPSDWKQ